MALADLLAEIVETAFRLFPVPTRTGVRVVGRPGRSSPVLLTGNYDLTVRRVLRALRGLDAYLIVAPSHGVNVWCASSGGHLTTHQVVTALKVARLEERVSHREVILPQLAATGVEATAIRRRTGWIARFGPTDAADIPAYLANGKQKTEAMRRVGFGIRERLEMAAAWATPVSLIATLVAWRHLLGAWSLIWALAGCVFLCFDRLPGSEWARRGVVAGVAVAFAALALAATNNLTPGPLAAWAMAGIAVAGVLTYDFAGSSPTAASGMSAERHFRVVLDAERCTGAYKCWEVCPEACFDTEPQTRTIAFARAEDCIRCGACIVQCPEDALAFETPDGGRVEPEHIRRFKLNLLMQRVQHAGSGED